jgi:hypothetical protein
MKGAKAPLLASGSLDLRPSCHHVRDIVLPLRVIDEPPEVSLTRSGVRFPPVRHSPPTAGIKSLAAMFKPA